MSAAPLEPLAPESYRDLVRRALAEDVGSGDVTTAATVDPDRQSRGVLLAKSRCVLAGLDVAAEAFRQLDPEAVIRVHHGDGSRCEPGVEIAGIQGRAVALLTAERTALNFMQRMTGIATLTRQFADAAAGRITILHVRLAGGVCNAVARMRAAKPDVPIEVEAQRLSEVAEALQAGADIILLDNLSTADIIDAVQQCRGRAKTEISGGVTLARIPELAATGADYVSIGALTHSAPAADLSFEMGI